jgi:exopolysaccharide production protein ExoY
MMDGSFDPASAVYLPEVERVADRTATHGQKFFSYRALGKRILDIAVVVFSAWLIVPLILICALLAARDGHFPFFGHKRVGLNGKEFKCWKIRTMVPDAEERLNAYLDANPAARAEWIATRKLKNDPRIIPFGSFMRKTSLDELPQLFNVLMGQMSIVGPRPVVRDELELYGSGRADYLALRPGITGLWQVSGRNDVGYADRVAFDRDYNARVSFWTDLSIMMRTFSVVVGRTGY